MVFFEVLLGLAIGFLVGFFTSFFKERGKNQALLKDIARLTEEKERVVNTYALDLKKRSYKYEAKSKVFYQYFNLIDEFNAKGHSTALEKMPPIFDRFYKDFLGANGNKQKETAATTRMSNELIQLSMKGNEELVKLKSETNIVRLIAKEETLGLLKELDQLFDLSMKLSSEMMKALPSLLVARKLDVISDQENNLKAIGKLIISKKEELVEQIRNELDEI